MLHDAAADPAWAWSVYEPDAARPWSVALAGHLYRRAAFGATGSELAQAIDDGPQATVTRLVTPPADAPAMRREYDEEVEAVARSGSIVSARGWWLRRMIDTVFPLQERLTLFWHNHFGISSRQVGDAGLMIRYVRLLREHALGSYRQLLQQAARDPAVLKGLGADASRKARPSQGFARQLLARLSLGPGNYGEEDVEEAARAFTGWFVLRGETQFIEREHDTGDKQVLGQRGQWSAEDVVRLVLDQPATPRLLVRSLYRWLVSEVDGPTDELLAPLAEQLGADQHIGRVVETILRSNWFYSVHAYRQRVKSPVELALSLIRPLESPVPTLPLGTDLAALGQDLYAPPTVAGWPGGAHWLNGATLLGRANLVHALLAPKGPYGGKLDPAEAARHHGHASGPAATRWLTQLLLQNDVVDDTLSALASDGADATLRDVTCRLATQPEFQLA